MSYRITQAAIDLVDENLAPSDKLLLITLARYADDSGGNCYPSLERLSTPSGLSRRTVQRSLSRLSENGYISVSTRPRQPSLYMLDLPRILEHLDDSVNDLSTEGCQDDTSKGVTVSGKGVTVSDLGCHGDAVRVSPCHNKGVTVSDLGCHGDAHKRSGRDQLRDQEEISEESGGIHRITNDAVSEISDYAESVVEAWNEICGPSLGRVVKLTESRRRAVESRRVSFPNLDWRELFTKVNDSSFLGGYVSDWKADFSWVIKSDDSVAKIIEGRYDDDPADKVPATDLEELEAMPDPDSRWICKDGVDLNEMLADGAPIGEVFARMADRSLSPYSRDEWDTENA